MIGFADWNMRRELSILWQECFGDSKRIPDFFLNNIFSPRDCLVYRVGNELAAAVYLLPAGIICGGKTEQAHYIFAAATATRFRSRGFMSSLLAYAAITGAERGDCFSAVLPADDGLYKFYADAGYEDFFQVRIAEADRASLHILASQTGMPGLVLPDFPALNSLRHSCLVRYDGSLMWDDRMFQLSFSMNQVYGDRLVCASQNGGLAYALCRKENDICEVLESFASRGMYPALVDTLLREVPTQHYRFRLPAGDKRFANQGQTVRFGMLKALGGSSLTDFALKNPYLGLSMD